MKALYAADLFCGAGGASTGALRASDVLGRKLNLVAVNHWERAVETHAQNHPEANHYCEDLTTMDPRKAVPRGKLDLLIAAPECTHHSVARGGKPVNDQSRASAWCVLRWCTALTVDRVLIENVPEFTSWGPIGASGKPLASKKGETFAAFVNSLKSLGYRVEWRILNAADFGGATTRRRLFIQAVRGKREIRWPEPTHDANPTPGLFGDARAKWRAAREIIDWSLPGESIFTRKRPLSENTLKRIAAGLRKFGGKNAEPFLVLLNGGGRQGSGGARTIDLPTPVVTASGGHIGLCEPFIIGTGHPNANGSYVYDPNNPLPTLTTCNEHRLVEPFIVPANYGEREGQSPRCHDVDEPFPTVVAGGVTHGLVEPFILPPEGVHRGNAPRSLDDPIQTITAGRGGGQLVEPFILPHRQFDGMQVDDVNEPLRTVTATNGGCNALVAPYLVPFYANGQADPVTDPLRTVTTKDRFGLVEPSTGLRLDIRFRMLQPGELARAMGFPADYKITGNRSEQVRQVGNAIVVEQAEALVRAMLEDAA